MKKFTEMFHLVANMMLIGLILIGIGVSFLMATGIKTPKNSLMLEADYSAKSVQTPNIQKINGNSENWIILEVSEDYSTAKVLKENGHEYYMTIYEANNTTISIIVEGKIHTFYY